MFLSCLFSLIYLVADYAVIITLVSVAILFVFCVCDALGVCFQETENLLGDNCKKLKLVTCEMSD